MAKESYQLETIMRFKLFFNFSTVLKKTINVPKGTFAKMMDHVAKTEQIQLNEELSAWDDYCFECQEKQRTQ